MIEEYLRKNLREWLKKSDRYTIEWVVTKIEEKTRNESKTELVYFTEDKGKCVTFDWLFDRMIDNMTKQILEVSLVQNNALNSAFMEAVEMHPERMFQKEE